MGAYTTIHVSEAKARAFLMQRIAIANHDQLGRMMDDELSDDLYNVRIVSSSDEAEDHLLPTP